MLENIFFRDDIGSLARANARNHHSQSINNKLAQDEVEKGWTLAKQGKWTSRLKKLKPRPVLFEHRVWTLLYRMGLPFLSGEGGAFLHLQEKNENQVKNQIDVVAIDDEIPLQSSAKLQRNLLAGLNFKKN